MTQKPLIAIVAALILVLTPTAPADTFGTPGNEFTIDFVTVGNPGNADDSGAGGATHSTPYGAVPYQFRMGKYEVSQEMITRATNSGLGNVAADVWSGTQPASNITWYEAAAFVNWLNTSTGHQAAYDLTWTGSEWTMNVWSTADAWQAGGQNLYRNRNALYFLPSEDEWYKAAYHKNDGVTANYWDYTTGTNSLPDGIDSPSDAAFGAVFHQGASRVTPNAVTDAGRLSPYGTMGQGGNAWEWMESAWDGSNDSTTELRGLRGGWYYGYANYLLSSERYNDGPADVLTTIGFRVAMIPEPSTALLTLCAGATLWLIARRRKRVD